MLRLLAFAIIAGLIFLIVRASLANFLAALRGTPGSTGARAALRDELVKDPVCATYIPRRKAITRKRGEVTHYFCSVGCADRFVS